MKRRLYTFAHNESLVKTMAREDSPFTAEEHAAVIEKESSAHFQSTDTLLKWHLSTNSTKLTTVGFITAQMYKMNFKNVVSFGAGLSVTEYLLKCALGNNAQVLASDFDVYYMQRAAVLFPSLKTATFDFFKDD